jgi:nicotinate-nucleotide pyrophosphorylase (carboxylating)
MMFKSQLNHLIQRALEEDLGTGDVTTQAIQANKHTASGRIICRQNGILAGVRIAEHVFMQHDKNLSVKIDYNDGDTVNTNETVVIVAGNAASILGAERVALNFLSHLSGIATLTGEYVKRISHTRATITDTRKTTPLLRALEKEAVRAGGGVSHRYGLYDMVLLKENHILAVGGIRSAVEHTLRFMKATNLNLKIEVETRDLEEVREALACNIDRIMLDNMTLTEIREAVELINHQTEVEVSGGVNLESVVDIAETGVDYISVGSLTHSAPAFDFTLLIDEV